MPGAGGRGAVSPELHALNTEHCGTRDGGGTGLCRCGLQCGWEAGRAGMGGAGSPETYLILSLQISEKTHLSTH